MKSIWLCLVLVSLQFTILGQESNLGQKSKSYNLGFENNAVNGTAPEGWYVWGSKDYSVVVDTVEKFMGKASALIEYKENATGFVCLASVIPVTFSGDVLTLKFYMKLEDVAEPVGMMLRIDGKSEVLGFDNMQQRGIKGSRNWEEYSISLPLSPKAEDVCIGPILAGRGKLWVDGVSLSVDGVDFLMAPPVERVLCRADSDVTEFEAGSKVNIKKLSVKQIKNLDVLGRVWGMLKYYHPAIANGDFNWDYELFRILPLVLNCKSDVLRNQLLTEWVKNIGVLEVNEGYSGISSVLGMKMAADLKWTEDVDLLGEELVNVLRQVKGAKRTGENYYVSLSDGAGNPKFTNENSYMKFIYPDAGYRLLSLFRYWNIIQYYFPYKYLIGSDWDELLTVFIPKFVDAENELEYQLAVLELMTFVDDTHCYINEYSLSLGKFFGSYMLPFKSSFVEGRLMLTDVLNPALANCSKLLVGDIILKVNGKTVNKRINEIKKYNPASNEPVRFRKMSEHILRSNDSVVKVVYDRNGKIFKDEVLFFDRESVYSKMKNSKASYGFLGENNDIGYIYIEPLLRDSVDFIMERFKNTLGIVIDLRCYPTDFPIKDLGTKLICDTVAFVRFSNGSISNPGVFAFSGNDYILGNKDCYKGKIVIIVNETTQSSAEFHAMAFKMAPDAIIIGSTTAGADGNVSNIKLPGGINSTITGIGVYYPDGGETQRVGIVPDLEVKPTINGVRMGVDEVLERAVELIYN